MGCVPTLSSRLGTCQFAGPDQSPGTSAEQRGPADRMHEGFSSGAVLQAAGFLLTVTIASSVTPETHRAIPWSLFLCEAHVMQRLAEPQRVWEEGGGGLELAHAHR